MPSAQELSPIPLCQLGDLVAENDEHLKSRYVQNEHYSLAESLNSNKIYFVGKKGFGKSALLSTLYLNKPSDQILDLRQQNIGLELLGIDNSIASLPKVAQSLFFKGLWSSALMIAIHHARGVQVGRFSKTTPQKAFENIRKIVGTDSIGLGMSSVFSKLLAKLNIDFEKWGLKVGIDVSLKDKGFAQKMADTEFLRQIHLAMTHFGTFLNDQVLYVLIDDLDHEWSNDPIQNRYLSALVDVIEKFGRIPQLKFVVGMRLDIFNRLDIQNPDKIIQHIHRLSWNRETLRKIVEHRLAEAFNEPKGRTLKRFNIHKKSGNAIENILIHCFPHPRDAIWTFQTILNLAHEQNLAIADQNLINHALQTVSASRISFVCAEWKSTYPWLPELLELFKGSTIVSSRDDLILTINNNPSSFIPVAEEVILSLLQTGLLGTKSRINDMATFFISEDPLPIHAQKRNFYEWHSAICHALIANTWKT